MCLVVIRLHNGSARDDPDFPLALRMSVFRGRHVHGDQLYWICVHVERHTLGGSDIQSAARLEEQPV